MHDSARISGDFYRELGAAGLAARTRPDWDRAILDRLEALLAPRDRVADIGCGYGRLTIPLARRGFCMTGLDLSSTMLAAARVSAVQLAADVAWFEGSMCQMPLESGAFDASICLWSAFYELLNHEEQLAALEEMHRILRPGGWALVEGPVYTDATPEEPDAGARLKTGGRLSAYTIEGLLNMHFRHDAESLSALMREAGIGEFRVIVESWGGRPRQFLRFEK
jgi:ubiquinone/menaquinone biosynthesis C-methylase UbiE